MSRQGLARKSLTRRVAIVAEMIKALHQSSSWCGETHVQKAVYLLQSTENIDLGYEFVLYKHGPYSFDLEEDLASMRGANLIEFVFPVGGYGPSVQLTHVANIILQNTHQFVDPFISKINFIANWFGPHDVRYLERLATAQYLRQQNPREEPYALAAKMRELKPHISERDSLLALNQLEEKLDALVAA